MAESDNTLQDWGQAYLELSDILAAVEGIKSVDLYYGQEQAIDSDGNWIPFRAPAVFLAFNAADVQELGDLSQMITMDITVYLAFETVQDSASNSLGRARSMQFIGLLRSIHQALHNASGDHFGPLSRTGIARVEAPPYMILYTQTYRCTMVDNGAVPQWDIAEAPLLPTVEAGADAAEEAPPSLFILPGL